MEVLWIFAAIRSVKHRALRATASVARLTTSGVCALRVSDIVSQRRRIHVRAGKGKKDRYVIHTSPVTYLQSSLAVR
jgi:site-specific recombinase XerD